MHLHFLYPSDPFDPKRPEQQFEAQISEIRRLGLSVSIVCLEELGQANCRIRGPIPQGAQVIYRGWMLSPGEYELLGALIEANKATPFTSPKMYLECHYLPGWYPLIAELTPETKVFPLNADFVGELRALGWSQFFIKDYVKSLKTSMGSLISKPEDIDIVLAEMQRFRGTIEGGVCVRRFEQFIPGSETRYFVILGKPYAASGSVPEIVRRSALRMTSRFFSVDVAMRSDSVLRVVEIGDGQVSDLVGWEPARFAELWKEIEKR